MQQVERVLSVLSNKKTTTKFAFLVLCFFESVLKYISNLNVNLRGVYVKIKSFTNVFEFNNNLTTEGMYNNHNINTYSNPYN